MSINQKLSNARAEFHKLKLQKSGRNKFAGFDYFELSDFLVPAMDCLRNEGLVTITTFTEDFATMYVREIDGDGEIAITSPMVRAEYLIEGEGKSLRVTQGAQLKGCHPIQNLGAEQTYQRRYLFVALMEIVEHDALDASVGIDESPTAKKPPVKKTTVKKTTPKKEPEESKSPADQGAEKVVLETEEDAEEIANMMIEMATKMHSGSVASLADFWKKNKSVIDALDADFPEQYERVKTSFTELRSKAEESNDE